MSGKAKKFEVFICTNMPDSCYIVAPDVYAVAKLLGCGDSCIDCGAGPQKTELPDGVAL